MDIDMVLNELSLSSIARDKQTARQRMLNLLDTANMATDHHINKAIRVYGQFYNIEITDGYSVLDWLSDREVDRDKRELLGKYFTKKPFLDNWQDTPIKDEKLLSDFFYNEEPAEGLGFAFMLRSLALSVRYEPPDPRWESSSITLKRIWIDEEDEDDNNPKSEEVQVVHASKVEHIQELIPWIEERIKTSVRDGNDLWQRKKELFPNLEFCEDVRKQLREVHYGIKLESIITRLLQLQYYCKKWKSGNFSIITLPRPGDARQESDQTLNHKKYGPMRIFRCPNGADRTFSWHMSVEENWRIYFFPYEEKPGRMIIGYIGKHPPTVNFPN